MTRDGEATTDAASTIAEASVGTYQETVTSTGTFQPKQTTDLTFAVSGEVTSVKVEEGDVVEKGRVLATVDTETLRAELEAAEASLDAAEEQLDSDTDADASDTQLAADEASITAAESRLALAEEALADAKLRATFAGTVASVEMSVGDYVSGTASSGSSSSDPESGAPGTVPETTAADTTSTSATITVMTADSFTVETSVGSADLEKLKKGLQAEMTPSETTETVYGTVSSVGLVASSSSSSGSATFPVEIDVTGDAEGLYAGGSADVSMIVSQRADVLTVPTAALSTADDGATTVTVETEDGEQVETPVEIGTAFGGQTEIVSGVSEGDRVVVTTVTPGRGGGEEGDGEEFPGGGQVPGGRGQFPGGGRAPGGQGG